jgi:hypothetical protein
MPTYAAGATVERRYPGPDADAARRAAEPQIQAFLAAGWMIGSERWDGDRQQGAPIGDAIATGTIGYLAGAGGELVVGYVAARATDLPGALPAYTLTNPRAENLRSYATVQVVIAVIVGVIFLAIFASIAGQMGMMGAGFGGPPVYVDGTFPGELVTAAP